MCKRIGSVIGAWPGGSLELARYIGARGPYLPKETSARVFLPVPVAFVSLTGGESEREPFLLAPAFFEIVESPTISKKADHLLLELPTSQKELNSIQ
jgi:hypothetical protein